MLRKSRAGCLVDWWTALHICRRCRRSDAQVSLGFIDFIHNRFQALGSVLFALDFDESGRIFACRPVPMNEFLAVLSSKMSMMKK
ncbi:MAG: hypothetical protein RET84_17995 [Pseudomonadota bacterium]|nr:hypothetical protein [Pseudomonadota bacterium]